MSDCPSGLPAQRVIGWVMNYWKVYVALSSSLATVSACGEVPCVCVWSICRLVQGVLCMGRKMPSCHYSTAKHMSTPFAIRFSAHVQPDMNAVKINPFLRQRADALSAGIAIVRKILRNHSFPEGFTTKQIYELAQDYPAPPNFKPFVASMRYHGVLPVPRPDHPVRSIRLVPQPKHSWLDFPIMLQLFEEHDSTFTRRVPRNCYRSSTPFRSTSRPRLVESEANKADTAIRLGSRVRLEGRSTRGASAPATTQREEN